MHVGSIYVEEQTTMKALEEQATFAQGWRSAVYDHIRSLYRSFSWPAICLLLNALL